MKEIKEIYVIYNPYEVGYYDGDGFGGILFARKYSNREAAYIEMIKLLVNKDYKEFLKLEMYYCYE